MFNLVMRINWERAGPQGSVFHPGSLLPPPLAPSFSKRGVLWPPPEQEVEASAELEQRLMHLQVSRVKPPPLLASWERCSLHRGWLMPINLMKMGPPWPWTVTAG